MSFPRYPKYKDPGVEWLGEVPEHWGITRLRFAADLNPSKSELGATDRDTLVSFLPMEAIGEDGSLRLDRERSIVELESGYTYFRDGDVVFAKITPCFENGKGAVMDGLTNGVGFGTTELVVARPRSGQASGRFLHYMFGSSVFRGIGESHMYGAGGQKRVPDSFVRDFATAFPPLREQETIVGFLDRETAKIDELVAEQQRLMELLKEKRQAVISHAVTKGLNPDAPTKPSGVEWLGEVPAHWDVHRVKTISSFITSGPRGWSDRVADEGALFIQSGDLDDSLGVSFSDAKRVEVADDAEADRTRLEDGDVVVCITGAKTGNVAVCATVPELAFINQHLCLIRPLAAVLPPFLGLVLKSSIGQTYFQLAQYGLKQGLSLGDIRDALVPLPPISEQQEIVSFIATVSDRFAMLSNQAAHAVALLHERRSALISAAVTGQIDVRDHIKEEAA